ncbi:ubiquitin-conjugating enzyme e2-24 kda [Phaffia rhodozyma]|uniref:Ubiquitin-conjugating enzyme E2 1 n=1 Tax=Phaffia rhodozyma TaxID=264483 RepID=A0A0F7SW27_PHARH|nr:ubiquitin-conjugating enzyme e2-24 kda [Phaffia rhodozyma]
MSDARLRRITKEISELQKDKTLQITVTMIDESPFHLLGTFIGPPDTPYEGGQYEVDIIIPDQYPFLPVKMKFITRLYHPNVSSQSGAICLDILKDQWTPVLTLKSTLISLQSLLCSPEPNDPQDAEVAKHYLTSRESFNSTARYWAQAYAGAPGGNSSKKTGPDTDGIALAGLAMEDVAKFEVIGFPRDRIVDCLRRLNYRGNNVKNISDDRVVEELLK